MNTTKNTSKLASATPKPSANSLTKETLCKMKVAGYEVWRQNNVGIFDVQKASAGIWGLIVKMGNKLHTNAGKMIISRNLKSYYRKSNLNKQGVPDIIGYRKSDGKAVYIEVKAGSDKLSTQQRLFLANAHASGCITAVVRNSQDIDKLIQENKK